MPQKTTYFFPKLHQRPALPPALTLTDWLEVCRDCGRRTSTACSPSCRRAPSASPCSAPGEGGDDTTAIDAAAEDAVVARLDALDEDFTLVSEELGERAFGAGAPWRVVVDPIDGSLNAKRGIPFFSLSLAVADGADDGRRRLRLRLRLRRAARSGRPSAAAAPA